MSRERTWPVEVRINRCNAMVSVREDGGIDRCGRLIWPWQDVVREYDPECGGLLVHHDCHHIDTRILWEDELDWRVYLECEHEVERAA